MSDAVARFREYAIANARPKNKGGIPKLHCEVGTPPRITDIASACGFTTGVMTIVAVFDRVVEKGTGEHKDVLTAVKVFAGRVIQASHLVGDFRFDDDGDHWPELIQHQFSSEHAKAAWRKLQPKVVRVVDRFLDRQGWF
jgi:hypothetical protein